MPPRETTGRFAIPADVGADSDAGHACQFQRWMGGVDEQLSSLKESFDKAEEQREARAATELDETRRVAKSLMRVKRMLIDLQVSLDKRVTFCATREATVDTRLAAIEQKCDRLSASIGQTEGEVKTQDLRLRTAWKTIGVVAAIVLGIVSLISTMVSINNNLRGSPSAATAPQSRRSFDEAAPSRPVSSARPDAALFRHAGTIR